MRIEEAVAKLLESPWDTDEIVKGLSKAQQAEVLHMLERVVKSRAADSDTRVAAVQAIFELPGPAAKAAVREHIDHVDVRVALEAIESFEARAADVVTLLLARIDAIAKRGDDLLMKAVVYRLVSAGPRRPAVIAALAKHWRFSVDHRTTLMASNEIFDALLEYAPRSLVAQAAFEAAAADDTEYGQVRGRAALALTGRDVARHVAALKKMTGLKPSSRSLRKSALDQLAAAKSKPAARRRKR